MFRRLLKSRPYHVVDTRVLATTRRCLLSVWYHNRVIVYILLTVSNVK